jgi:hypothetical protein
MRSAESPSRRPPISLTTGLLLAATLAALGGETSLRLPFDIFPGAAYLALLRFPAMWREDSGTDAGADLQFGVYGGPAYTARSAFNLAQPGGTDMRLDNIAWEGRPFRPPPYYGLRAIYWLPATRLGLMGDFTHIKAVAIKDRPVDQSGRRDGVPVLSHESLSATFARLEFTHGYNLFTVNLVGRGALRGGALVPYAGVGLGVAYPHVEVQRAGAPQSTRTYTYQVAGPAMQVLGGIEWRFGRRLSLFVEYKLSCAAIRGDLKGGGDIATNLCTHQLLGGPAVHLRAREAIAGSS